jgi:Zn-dependent protease
MFQDLERRSHYLGNLAGVPIFVHWSVAILVILVAGSNLGGGLYHILLLLITLVLGIVLHELGHALAARSCGAHGITITLWALGGLCRSRRDSTTIGREIIIVAAGPAVSLALSLGCDQTLAWLKLHRPDLLVDAAGKNILYFLLLYGDVVNWSLFLFNMLPIFPLDGGQLTFYGTLGLTRNQLLARQVSLFLAIFGSLAYFLYRTGLFAYMELDRARAVGLWMEHLGFGDVILAFFLAYLVRSAWSYLR